MHLNFNYFKKSALFFQVLLVASCELVVNVDIPEEPRKPVVNSLMNPDSTWSVNVSWSKSVLDEKPTTFIENAIVKIKNQKGEVIEVLVYDKHGYYRSANGRPEGGQEYSVEVDIPEYKTVIGRTRIPTKPEITNGTIKASFFNSKLSGKYSVSFKDNAAEQNYYDLSVYSIQDFGLNQSTEEPLRTVGFTFVQSDDPAIAADILPLEQSILFSDKLFNADEIILHLKTPDNHAGHVTLGNVGGFFVIKSVSKEYYDYATTLKLQYKVSKDPLAQPVAVSSNIENGLGVIASYNTSVYYVLYPAPIMTSFTPSQGRPGDIIRIEGENLSQYPLSSTTVYFLTNEDGHYTKPYDGIVPAQILESSPTTISVAVPAGAKTNSILLESFGHRLLSSQKFVVIE